MYQRKRIILDLMADYEYHTLEELASTLSVSTKTARKLLHDLNSELEKHGSQITSRYKKGFRLEIRDMEKYTIFHNACYDTMDNSFLPSTSEERIQYLLEYLFNTSDYVKLDDLSESLYISRRTLSTDIKEVESYISKFSLKLLRKPNYGIKIEGKEFDTRLCIASFSSRRLNKISDNARAIAAALAESLKDQDLIIRGVAYQNLIAHLSIAIARITDQHIVLLESGQKEQIRQTHEYQIAEKIAQKLESVFHIVFPEDEIAYIAVHLAGKEFFETADSARQNIVITQEISDIVTEMLENVYIAFKFDFRDDLELRMTISQHLVPLIVRTQYNMDLKNPLLHDVKKKFFLAYTIASNASTVINRQYQTRLSEDEIGYLAFAFALALERKRTAIKKKNVILVCSSGSGSNHLLTYKYKNMFGAYINRIVACDEGQLSYMDFSQFDYIFTTVPIRQQVPIPVLEVEYFMNPSDMSNVKKALSPQPDFDFDSRFPRELFLTHLHLEDKESTLRFLCEVVINKRQLPAEFYNSVLERERLANTAFGNLIAMPHSFKTMSKETFVCIGILDHPILWNDQSVQVVFLTSIADKGQASKELQRFYQILATYSLSPDYIRSMIQEQDYNIFIEKIRHIEENMPEEE